MRDALFSGTSPDGEVYNGYQMFAVDDDHGGRTDATVEGTPGALDLWLWGRGSIDLLAVGGDESLVTLLREAAARDTQ